MPPLTRKGTHIAMAQSDSRMPYAWRSKRMMARRSVRMCAGGGRAGRSLGKGIRLKKGSHIVS